MIIHDTDDEEQEGADDEEHETGESGQGEETEVEQQTPADIPPPRTRKAKDMQTRLGVGRPVAAGGSGPRAVTKSLNVSRGGKRGKSSKTMKPTEETILEEGIYGTPCLKD